MWRWMTVAGIVLAEPAAILREEVSRSIRLAGIVLAELPAEEVSRSIWPVGQSFKLGCDLLGKRSAVRFG
jgi:hypothetical protein